MRPDNGKIPFLPCINSRILKQLLTTHIVEVLMSSEQEAQPRHDVESLPHDDQARPNTAPVLIETPGSQPPTRSGWIQHGCFLNDDVSDTESAVSFNM